MNFESIRPILSGVLGGVLAIFFAMHSHDGFLKFVIARAPKH